MKLAERRAFLFVLERIFADPSLSRILRFKGGTSLSKAHGLIERFSEDVDLILDWTRFLALGDPNAERSKTKQGAFNELMNETAGRYVSGELREQLQAVLGDVCRVEPDAEESALHVHNAFRLNKGQNRPTVIPEASNLMILQTF